MKIYVLSHARKYEESADCTCGHSDTKLIGVFNSENLAKATLEKYKNLEGFRDHVEGFQINEYVLDSIYNTQLSELIERSISQTELPELLYLLYFVEDFEDGHNDSKILGVFSSQEKGQNAITLIESIRGMESMQGQLEIYENRIDQVGWKKGFVTIE